MTDSSRDSNAPSTLLSSSVGPQTFTRREELEIGSRLGQFRVEAVLGRGGRGVVYRAYDEKLKRAVALKVMADASGGASVWLLEEARAAASLTHSSIAAIHDVQQQEGVVFIVMELVLGETLRSELRRGPLPLTTTLRYARDIASALARAHKSGIVHRDLKPENVMITPDGDAKVLDFGLARVAPDTPPSSSETGVTGVAGTPGYMSPEQALGRRVDVRSDVFSFGIVVWEMLAGARPFERTDGASTFEPLLPIEAAAPLAPRALTDVVIRCLAVSPTERFASADEILSALRTVEITDVARPAPPRRGLRLAAVALATAVAGGLVVVGRGGTPLSEASHTAPTPGPAPVVPTLNVTSPPELLTHEGLCSGFPVFADDGSLIYARQNEHDGEMRRLDLETRADTVILRATTDASLSTTAGAPGSIVYMVQGEGLRRELWQLTLSTKDSRDVVEGADPAFANGAVLFTPGDGRAIRQVTPSGTNDLLYEAPSVFLYSGLATSVDGRWLSAIVRPVEERASNPVCLGPLGHGAPLDCTSIGEMTSLRGAFSRSGGALYFAHGESLVRFDLEARTTTTVPMSPAPVTLAVSPDGTSVAFSSCRPRYDAIRVDGAGSVTPLTAFGESVGLLFAGPHGELAFPVARGNGTALAVTDEAGTSLRVVTTPDRVVTEAAFSPDGHRIVFHDANESGGGLFVVDTDGRTAPRRLTSTPSDSLPSWLDAEHVVYMHPENGLPYGKPFVLSAAGGEPRALANVPGILLGGVPSRGTMLIAIRNPAGDRFAEVTVDGKVHDITLRGMPRGTRWEVATAASPSGRYAAWYSGGSVWRADFEAKTASKLDFPRPIGAPDALQPDDTGRVAASFRRSEGQLYRARGTFP